MLQTFVSSGPEAFYRRHLLGEPQPDKDYFVTGALVEQWLIYGLDYVKSSESEFLFGTAPAVSTGKLGTFCTTYLSALEAYGLEDEQRAFDIAYETAEYSYPKERVRAELEKPMVAKHLEERREALASGKRYVPLDIQTHAAQIVQAALNDPLIGRELQEITRGVRSQSPDNDLTGVFYQREYRWSTFIEVQGKTMRVPLCIHPDLVLVQDSAARIIDIKTTSKPVRSFAEAYRRYGYFRQMGMYHQGVSHWIADQDWDGHPPYVEHPEFMVIPKLSGDRPLMFVMSDDDLTYAYGEYIAVVEQIYEHHLCGQWTVPLEYHYHNAITLREFPLPR